MTTTRETLGVLLLYLSSSLSSAAGVGGGSVNVAIFYIVMNYTFHESVIFSLSTLLGNYSLQVFINWNKRHPLIKTRPLIYWDVILLLLPAQLGGADLGVILGYIFPETLLIIFAIIVLLITSTVTLLKGINLHHKETIKLHQDDDVVIHTDDRNPLLPSSSSSASSSSSSSPASKVMLGSHDLDGDIISSSSSSSSSLLYPNMNEDGIGGGEGAGVNGVNDDDTNTSSSAPMPSDPPTDESSTSSAPVLQIPWIPVLVVFLSWLIYALFYVIMNDVTICSVPYFVFFALVYPILVIEVTWGYFYIKSTQDMQLDRFARDRENNTAAGGAGNNGAGGRGSYQTMSQDDDAEIHAYLQDAMDASVRVAVSDPSAGASHPFVKGDIRWGQSVFMPILVVFFAFCVGITSALLGIGGGELMGPLLLKLKVLPLVSSATVPVMSLLNTSSSIIHYMTIDDVDYEVSLLMFFIGALGGLTGRSIAIRLTSWLKRPSILVFFLVSILMLSVILFAYELSIETADFNFGSFC